MKKNKKSSVLRKVKHQVQNENRSSFSEKVKTGNLVTNWIKRLKEKPIEIFVIFNRLYNLIRIIRKLNDHFNLF